MLPNDCLSEDFTVDNFGLAIWPLYLTLLTVTAAVSVVWIFRRQRSSMESQWHAPTPFLEHKSLESTNNFDENAFRQPVGDLGKGILDQQSEEVDANESPNNINFFQQLVSLECTTDGKLMAPQKKIEISSFTEQSKLFGNDFTAPSIGDNSGRIDVNFLAIQQVEKDEDEIENDLERGSINMGCHDPFTIRQNMSEHIVVDLNMTPTFVKNDEDMSITDTVHIPSTDKKVSFNKYWIADKENIAINAYVAPFETNVTVNEKPDQVLVLDGKLLTLQPDIPEKFNNCRETLLPNSAPSMSGKSSQNCVNSSVIQQVGKDDLDEIEKDLERGSRNMGWHSLFSNLQNMSEHIEVDLNMMPTVVKNDEDMSIMDTMHIPLQDLSESASTDKKASLNSDWVADKENIAINPYAAPCETNVAVNEEPDQVLVFDGTRLTLQPVKPEKERQTLLPNYSAETTQSFVEDVNDDLPKSNDGKNIFNSKCKSSGFRGLRPRRKKIKRDANFIPDTVPVHKVVIKPKYKKASKRETIVFNDGACNMCFTQALPVNAMLPDKQTQQKCRTVKFGNDSGNISDKQTFPLNVILPNNNTSPERPTVLHEDPENLERRRTVVYEDDTDNISVTQALLSNIWLEKVQLPDNKENNGAENFVITQLFLNYIVATDSKTSRYGTIVYENDTGNISITQIEQQLKLKSGYSEEKPIIHLNTPSKPRSKKRTTIVNDNDESHIFMSESIYYARIKAESEKESKSVVYDEDPASISMALAISANNYLFNELDSAADVKKPEEIKEVKEKVINDGIIEEAKVDTYEGDIFMTGAISTNIMEESTNKRKAMASDEADSKYLAILTNVYLLDGLDSVADIKKSEEIKEVKEKVIADGIIEEAKVDTDAGDIFLTGAISTNIMGESSNERVTFTIAHDDVDSKSLAISTKIDFLDKLDSAADITKPIKSMITIKEKVIDCDVFQQDNRKITEDALQDTRKSTVFDANGFNSETSMTTGIATVPSLQQTEKRRTVIFGNDNCNISMKHPTPAKLISYETELLCTTKTKSSNLTMQNRAAKPQSDIMVLQAFTANSKQLTASINEQINLKNPLNRVPSCVEVQKAINSKVAIPNTQKVVSLPVIPVSTTDMSVHTPCIEKPKIKLITSTTDRMIDKVSEGNDDSVTKESLSNISHQTVQRGTYDTSVMAILESDPPSAVMPQDASDNTSTESIFYIMKDSEVATQTDRKMNPKNEEEQVVQLQRQLSDLKTIAQNSALPSRTFGIDKRNEHFKIKQESDNSSRPSDTQDLLDVISNFTGCLLCEDNLEPVSIEVKDQGETTEDKQVSVALSGHSIALSREDLLRNILMAEALLHKCRLALGARDCKDEDTRDASVEISNKSDRRSYKVDKTFQFGDESITEDSLTYKEKFSPLKKTAFGETSYLKETKGKVIPTYFQYVSDGIKELMLDLVKPVTNDNMPVEHRLIYKDVTQNTSTHSAQIQVNLATSGQKKDNTLKPKQAAVLVFDYLVPLNNILLAPNYSKDGHKFTPRQMDETRCGSGKLLKDISKGNNYEVETVTTTQFTMITPEPSTMQDDIVCFYQKDARFSKKYDHFISQSTSTTSGSISVDKSVDAISRHLRNAKVNTNMKMRKKSEMLGASLSLVLVEDASEDADRALTSDSNKHTNLKVKFSISPHVNIQGEAAKMVKVAKLSGIRQQFYSSNSRVSATNSKTRICSPSKEKHEQYSPSEEVTPKPIPKISKSSTHKGSAVLSSPDYRTKSRVNSVKNRPSACRTTHNVAQFRTCTSKYADFPANDDFYCNKKKQTYICS